MLIKQYYIVSLIFFCISSSSYSQFVIDTVSWGGSGTWCSICDGDSGNYACSDCTWGCPGWNNGQKSFTDAVPFGNIVTTVSVTVYYVSCGLDSMTIELNAVIIDIALAPGDSCVCGGCDTLYISKTFSCGLPGYNYGGNNTIKLIPDGTACVSEAIITLYYAPSSPITISTSTIDAFCGGSNGSVDLTVSGGVPPYTYNWSTGDTTQDITGLSADTYTVTVTDSVGCEETSNITITDTPPALPINLGQDTTICEGDTIILDAGSGFQSYLWSDSSTNQTLPVSTSGTYYVEVIDSNGCTISDTISLANFPSPIVELGNDTTVCSGVVLDAENCCNTTYLWSTGETTQTVYASSTGTFWVEVSNACATIRDSIIITIDSLPVVDLANDTSICNTCSITLDAGTGFTSYSWSTGENTQTITVDSVGTYIVQIIDSNGCSNIDSITISFLPTNIIDDKSHTNENIKIYPNPNNGTYTILQTINNKPWSFSLHDILGRLIYQKENISDSQYIIDISEQPNGMYFVKVIPHNKTALVRKIILE